MCLTRVQIWAGVAIFGLVSIPQACRRELSGSVAEETKCIVLGYSECEVGVR